MIEWEHASTVAGRFEGVPEDHLVWRPVEPPVRGSDDDDHWFRAHFTADGPAPILVLGGLATVCDVFVDGTLVLRSESMFAAQRVPVAPGEHELHVCARALAPLLTRTGSPRARWRTKVASSGSLRWFRTSLYGRAEAFAPPPPVVGPWRPAVVLPKPHDAVVVRATLDGLDGVVSLHSDVAVGPLEVAIGGTTRELPAGGGTVAVRRPDLWWPHTHGTPRLHELAVRTMAGESRQQVGFRRISAGRDIDHDGLALRVNDVDVFVRGAIWTPVPPNQVRATLECARNGGMNMIRVVGTMRYEDSGFFDACDELGILVWQDLMFANMDYPFAEDGFRQLVDVELEQLCAEIGDRPSVAVVCGGSEVEQQAAMLGLAPEIARSEFFDRVVPARLEASGVDALYVPSAPTGGPRPFRNDRGVSHYFGVGAYLRPLEDARRADVRFAAECLAFANAPDREPDDRTEGVMRDAGAAWDFADVRDHYLAERYGVGPGDDRYWEWARLITGEVMADVFGEWRRAASANAGGLVLWLRDLVPGSGWGLLDSDGRPKPAWYVLRRALAPIAVWFVDEGLNGLRVHVANDNPDRLDGSIRLALSRDDVVVEELQVDARVEPHSVHELDVEQTFGRFVDATYAYRFGAPQHDLVTATLTRGGEQLSQAFFYRSGFRLDVLDATELGLSVEVRDVNAERPSVLVSARRLVRGVRIAADGFAPEDDAFDLEPGGARAISLLRAAPGEAAPSVTVRALNLRDVLAW